MLNFSTSKTMRLAQQLYEGIDIEGQGTVGIITYLRTDSTRVSEEAARMATEYISQTYGEEYLHRGETKKSSGKKIQDAHEAIRPTDITRLPAAVKDSLSRDQFRLYQLIWKRFTASWMADAKYNTMAVKIDGGGYRFTVSASTVAFDGFMSVYVQDEEEKGGSMNLLKELGPDSELTLEGTGRQTAFYPAAGPLYGGCSGKDAGGAGNRTTEYLCADHQHHYCPPLCGKGRKKPVSDRAWRGGQQYDEAGFPEYCGTGFHGQCGVSS